MHADRMQSHRHAQRHHAAAPYAPPSYRPLPRAFPGFPAVAVAGLAGGLGLTAFGGGSLAPLLRLAAPLGGGYLGWTRGADILRTTGVGQSVVGWLANSPVGGLLGPDPYKPVGGALGALTGYALGNILL